jgi:hypothetical protein
MTRRCATVLCAMAMAASIGGAPTASADPSQPQQPCTTTGPSSSVCQSPGDVEINDTPPSVSFYPYGGEGGLL